MKKNIEKSKTISIKFIKLSDVGYFKGGISTLDKSKYDKRY